MNKKVAIERCRSYDPDEVYGALKKAVDLAEGFDVAGKTVLLKPNIVFDTAPEKAICTHPVFLEAAIRLMRELGAKRILAGDSPGLQAPGFTAKASGLGEAAKRNGAEWVDFTAEKVEFPCPEGKVIKKLGLTGAAREADLIISLPKLKTHQLLYFSGAMKNLFGLMPSVAKTAMHVRFQGLGSFASMLVDLNLAVKHSCALMDAVVGMEGPGPSAGSPRNIGLVLASSNLLAMDAAACVIIGYPPWDIPMNSDALARGYWLSDFNEIEYPGLSPEDVHIPDFSKVPFQKSASQLLGFVFPLPRPAREFMNTLITGPEINHSACIRCGDCSRICGSQVMSFTGEGKGRRIVIDYRRCIRCFCCHEICPEKAIEIKKRPRNRPLPLKPNSL